MIRYRRSAGLMVDFAAQALPGSSMWNYFAAGNQPAYERGVFTELIEDDGGAEFDRRYKETRVNPVVGSIR